MQPKDATDAKSKLRKLPPKEEVKRDSFQGIQLKPVTKEPKEAQQAEKNGVELKVDPLKGINELAAISVLLQSAARNFTVLNDAREIYLCTFSSPHFIFQDVSHFVFLILQVKLIRPLNVLSELIFSVNNTYTLRK